MLAPFGCMDLPMVVVVFIFMALLVATIMADGRK
jgi:hypothetical protein